MLPLEEARLAYKKFLISYDILCKEFEHPSPTSTILDKEYVKILVYESKIICAYLKEKQNDNEYHLRRIKSIIQESNFKMIQIQKMNVLFKKMN